MFRVIQKNLRVPDLVLMVGIGLIALIHTSLEKTLYYWDFGDYQRNLIQLHIAAKDGFQPFLSQLWEYQNSEYPVSWAGPFALFPYFSFTNRAAFTILISVVGIYLWAKSMQVLSFKIFKNLELSKLALFLLCCSAGPWMLSLRGWPDVIACGLIWFGFAKSFETKKLEEFIWGFLLISLGVVMRKTTFDLAFCLVLISLISVFKIKHLRDIKDVTRKTRVTLLVQILLLTIWISVNPGFLKSIFLRNNRDFYKPFQVTFEEYVNNLVAMNGSIYLALSSIAVIFLLFYSFKQRRIGLLGLGIFPFLFTAIWMNIFRQATDHHMVQWVPTFGTLGLLFTLDLVKQYKKWQSAKNFTLVIGYLSLAIVLVMPQTPFASPSNAFARPFAHSVAPVQRPDITNLADLKLTLEPLILEGNSIVSLNESQEFNQGTLKAMFQDLNFKKTSLLPLGSMDFRDDPEFRNLLSADYVLAPDPFIPLIPKFQNTLREINSSFQRALQNTNYWVKIAAFEIGDVDSSSTWWSVDYAKKNTELILYKKVYSPPLDFKRAFVSDVYRKLILSDIERSRIQLVDGPKSFHGASMSNNQLIEGVFNSGEEITVFLESSEVEVITRCPISIVALEKIISFQAGRFYITKDKLQTNFMTIRAKTDKNPSCAIQLRPTI